MMGLTLMLQFTSHHDNAATNLANSGWTRDALLIRKNSSSQSRNSLWQWQPFCSTDGASTSIRMAGMSFKPFFFLYGLMIDGFHFSSVQNWSHE